MVDISLKMVIMSLSKYHRCFLGNRKAEDSLENTLNCVPKVQGVIAESLRQTDRDAYNMAVYAMRACMQSL